MGNTDNSKTATIAPTTLGRYKAEIEAVKTATKKELKAMGFDSVETAIDTTKKSIALRLKISVKELDTMMENLKAKNANSGKREADKATRDQLITETQDLLSVVNLATAVKRNVIVLSDKDKIKAFNALGDFGEVITDHLKNSFSPVGGMTMFWNPQSQVQSANDGLAVYIGGWEDGSKNLRYQYAPRKCPISKRSGYRDDSFDCPVYGQDTKAETEQPEAQPEAEKTES